MPRTTGISFSSAAFAHAIIPSNTTFPLNCSTSVALVIERSNNAYGSAGEIVVQRNAFLSLNNLIVSSSIFAPCSIESTPFSRATRTPCGDSTCAETKYPFSCALSQTAFTISGDIFSSPGTPFSFASITPPVIISFIKSTFSFSDCSRCFKAVSILSAATATEPAICPPGTEIPSLAASILGPIFVPALISSLNFVSKLPSPPTVLIVVTPLISSVFANPATIPYAIERISAFPISIFTSFSLSRCFFCGLPLPAR